METTTKYYIYIRKSTDEEDRQVLSLESQLNELKEFAEREHIEIVETFIEKKTAKVPGREVFNSMLDKLVSGYLDNLIDEDTYRTKKSQFVEQKISLKNEKESLLRRQMSGWIEPAREYIKTLCQAEKIASVESLAEISQFVQKIGTNRLISEKSPSWIWKPEFEFAETTIRRFAERQNGSAEISFTKTSRSPILCAL